MRREGDTRARVSVLVRFVVEGGGGGGVSTIKITWADTRAAQRRRPGSPVSRFFLFYSASPLLSALLYSLALLLSSTLLSFLLLHIPRYPPAFPAGPGPRVPSRPISARSPPTRSSRTVPQHYLQFARYRARKCEHRSCLAPIFRVDPRVSSRGAR